MRVFILLSVVFLSGCNNTDVWLTQIEMDAHKETCHKNGGLVRYGLDVNTVKMKSVVSEVQCLDGAVFTMKGSELKEGK